MSPTNSTAADAAAKPTHHHRRVTKLAPLAPILGTVLGIGASAHSDQGNAAASVIPHKASLQRTSAMKISIKVEGKVMTATLADSATARDFASLLPMTVTLN